MNTFVRKLGVVVRVSVFYIFVAYGNTCGPSEYKSSKGECCPMCNIGLVVLRDCIGDFSTTCIPCSQGKFMDTPNGFYICFICKLCSGSKGLYTQSQCNTIKDTVCDVLDGYYCIDYADSKCQHAQKHSVCKPGNKTKTPGTKTSDTVCVDCPFGFYSPTGVNCTRWTDCAAKNEIETEAGSSVRDVTCTQKTRDRYGLIVFAACTGVIVGIIAIIAIIYGLRSQKKQSNTSSELNFSTQETNQGSQASTSQIATENKEEEEKPSSTDHKLLSVLPT